VHEFDLDSVTLILKLDPDIMKKSWRCICVPKCSLCQHIQKLQLEQRFLLLWPWPWPDDLGLWTSTIPWRWKL